LRSTGVLSSQLRGFLVFRRRPARLQGRNSVALLCKRPFDPFLVCFGDFLGSVLLK
jgi:hypothetical protein